MTPGALDRIRQTRRLLRQEGAADVAERLLDRAAGQVVRRGRVRLPVSKADLVRAGEIAASGWVLPEALPARPEEPLTIGWVCVPPGSGSGGHRTMLRMVHALE